MAKEKEGHDLNSLKGWMNVLNECCSAELGPYGVTAELMRLSKGDVIFGVNFRCDAARLQPNKLKLTYDRRTDGWTWPREEVPGELAALHVDSAAWTAVWDKTKGTYQKAAALERGKRVALQTLARLHSDASSRYQHANKFEAAFNEIERIERSIEREWGNLLEVAEDALFMWGIIVRLSYENVGCGSKDKLAKNGIILRFKPIVSTVPVANATIAAPLPSAPESDDI